MHTTFRPSFAPALALALGGVFVLAGCDVDPKKKEACEGLAKHLADVIQTEQGEAVPQDQVDAMVDATAAACLEHTPTEDEMACAMSAQTSAAIKACDPTAEAKPDEKVEDTDG